MALVTVERYRLVTGDQSTAASAVSAAIEEAVDVLSEDLGWQIESAERTETLTVLDGRVYPSSVPITAVPSGQSIDGHAVIGAAPFGQDFITEGADEGETRSSLTYTGGWTSSTVPAGVARDLAWAAYGILRPETATSVPDGATSVRLGDASVTFAGPQARSRAGLSWSAKTMRWHIKHRRVGTP